MYNKRIPPIDKISLTNSNPNNFPLNPKTNNAYKKKQINSKLCPHTNIVWIIPNQYGYCKSCGKYIKKSN